MKLNRRERVLLWVLITYALMVGCAHAPPSCSKPPSTYAICASQCPDGRAFIFENATEVACYCGKKPPEGT